MLRFAQHDSLKVSQVEYYFIKNQSTVVIPAEAGIQIIDEIGFRIKCGMTSVQKNVTEH